MATKSGLLQEAEDLWNMILKTKLTAADPWTYTPKARAWAERAQHFVEKIAANSGQTVADQFAAFVAEVEADPDFQAARQRL